MIIHFASLIYIYFEVLWQKGKQFNTSPCYSLTRVIKKSKNGPKLSLGTLLKGPNMYHLGTVYIWYHVPLRY